MDKAEEKEVQAYERAWVRITPYAEQCSLPFGQMRNQQRGGALKSASAGGSTEFYDHRQYVPGDDIRHINWAASARSEMITLKQFQQDSSPHLTLYLDASESMRYDIQKWERTLDLLALSGLSVARAGVRVSAFACKGALLEPLSLTSPNENQWLMRIKEEKNHGFQPPKSTGMPSLHVYITDLLYEGDPQEWVSAHCRAQDMNLFFSPTCEAETSPPWENQSQLIDPETQWKEEYKVNETLLRSYHSAYQKHFSMWRHALSSVNGRLGCIPAEAGFYEAVLKEAVPNGLLVI